MEYQELIDMWKNTDGQVQQHVSLNRKLIKEVGFRKIRARLYEIKWTALFELLVGIFWVPFLLKFALNHLSEFRFLAPAMVLLAISAFSMLLQGYKLSIYFRIRPQDSVQQTQEKLARLQYFELLGIQSLYFIIPAFVAPFFIVMAKAVLNLDLYAHGMLGQILLYLSLGSIPIAIVLGVVLSRFPNKQLREARAFLRELKDGEET